jgi:type III secretion protein T
MLILASPVLLIMFLIEVGLALVSRFAPQLQVFFLAMPIKSAVGLLVLVVFAATLFDFGGQVLLEGKDWPYRLDRIFGGTATR